MIKAEHGKFHIWFSKIYTNFFLSLAFRKIRIVGEPILKSDRSVLMIANHFSWWDGFLQIRLNSKVFNKKYHFMMLESELSKVPILRKIGACSIKKGSRSAIESLQYMVEVIQQPKNLFLFFPQGEIQSIYTFNFEFEKGALGYLLKKVNSDYDFVFNVNLIDYAAFKRPEVTMYYKLFLVNSDTTLENIEKAYNDFAKHCISLQKAEIKKG